MSEVATSALKWFKSLLSVEKVPGVHPSCRRPHNELLCVGHFANTLLTIFNELCSFKVFLDRDFEKIQQLCQQNEISSVNVGRSYSIRN